MNADCSAADEQSGMQVLQGVCAGAGKRAFRECWRLARRCRGLGPRAGVSDGIPLRDVRRRRGGRMRCAGSVSSISAAPRPSPRVCEWSGGALSSRWMYSITNASLGCDSPACATRSVGCRMLPASFASVAFANATLQWAKLAGCVVISACAREGHGAGRHSPTCSAAHGRNRMRCYVPLRPQQ